MLAEYGSTGVTVKDACSELGIPLIVHFHGYDAYKNAVLEEFGHAYPALFQQAAAVIAVSKDMEKQLLSLGAVPERLHYNPYGVDPSKFRQTDPGKNEPVFVTVGRFVDKKAPYLTILAFKAVVERIPEARLTMIGDGYLREACNQLVRSLNLSGQVELLGSCSHEQVAATMQKSRAFVQHSIRPTQGDSEGTPVAILEAGSSGIPVIATRHAGIKDVVLEQKTGLLVDEGDITGMAESMVQVAKSPILATQLGEAAREWISTEFSMETSFSNLSRIIENAINVAG